MKPLVLCCVALLVVAASAFATVKGAPDPRPARGLEAEAGQAPATEPGHEPPPGAPARAEQPHGQAPAPHAGTEAARETAVEHESGEAAAAESPWATVARLFNFALLAGILIYLLRSPFGAFLEDRRLQIGKQLTDAAEMKATAQQQLALIDQKMSALPAELESLKQRGAAEIAAEEARIRAAAELERQKMLENATREIGRRAQLAERHLQQRAGELAVSVATERVKRTITDDDQRRLVDRYLEQVRPETIGS